MRCQSERTLVSTAVATSTDGSGDARGRLPVICRRVSGIRHRADAPTVVQLRAAGERIDRHRHDNHQLVYVSSGVIAVSTAAGRWVASAERAVWLPAQIWHEHR